MSTQDMNYSIWYTIVPISGRSSRIVVLANDDDDADDVSWEGLELLLGAVCSRLLDIFAVICITSRAT